MENQFLLESVKIANVLVPVADRFNTDPDTAPVLCENFGKVLFILLKGAGATGTATVIAKAASDASKTGAEAIPFKYKTIDSDTVGALTAGTTSGITAGAGANLAIGVEVDVRDCPDGKNYVYLDLTEVANDPVTGGVVAILHSPRYKGTSPLVLA